MSRTNRDATTEKIIDTTKDLLVLEGLTGWTVQDVASRVGCAKGLILYHFGSKESLLEKAGSRLLEDRIARRTDALAGESTRAIDRLWGVIEEDVRSGRSRAWLSLISEGPPALRTQNPAAWARITAAAARAIDVPAMPGGDQSVLDALNGFEVALVQGRPPEMVRESYDRYWLRLLDEGV